LESGSLATAHLPERQTTETPRHRAERVARRLRRQRVTKNSRNTNAGASPFAFLLLLLTRVSAGMLADVRRVDVGACASFLGAL